ncbi:MAG: large conductance mechanosensitive channel protein MscL [Actinomycetota bacterium]
MGDLLKEFRDFVNRGNLIDLAIAVVLATFFAPIITALVDGVIMNLIAAIFGQPSFDSITIDVGDATLLIGSVITAIVNFVIVAFVCFFIVKSYNALKAEEDEDEGPSELDVLEEIRDELRSRG